MPDGQLSVGVKGNQVRILSDPVTVNGETGRKEPLCFVHEKGRLMSAIRESGNLLEIRCKASEESDLPIEPERVLG